MAPELGDGRVAVHDSARRPRKRSTGTASSAMRPSGRSSRSGCSAGATTGTTAPGSPATCSCTCFRDSLRPRLDRPHARHGHRRAALLARRAGCPGYRGGLYDYPKTDAHPAFTLMLKVNFADGGGGEGHLFRFSGPDGVITIGGTGVTLARQGRSKDPGLSIGTFPKRFRRASSRVIAKSSRRRPAFGRARRPCTPRRRATATRSITSAISSTRYADA